MLRLLPRTFLLALFVLGAALTGGRAHFARMPSQGSAPLAARLDDSLSFPMAQAGVTPAMLPTDLSDRVEKVLPGVVNISTITRQKMYGVEDFFNYWGVPHGDQPQTSLGSGFIISKDGYVVTNNHVIEGADEVFVTLLNKKSYSAKIIGRDEKMDLAIVKVREKNGSVPGDLVPVPLGDSDRVRIAETVFAVGNPFGLQHTVTTGIISAMNRTIGLGPFDNFLQTDASINPGNSGGPLFNLKGEVVGINTSIYSRTGQSAGIGFAIPVVELKKILEDLKKYGKVPRPWLGILGQPMNPQIAGYYDLATEEGVLVVNLVAGAPGDDAGLTRGDIIVSVNGTTVSDNYAIEREIYKKKPREKITLEVYRGRKRLKINAQLEELPNLSRVPRGMI